MNICFLCTSRTKNFEKSGDYANTWGKNDDGCVNADGPRQIVGEQTMVSGGFVTRSVGISVLSVSYDYLGPFSCYKVQFVLGQSSIFFLCENKLSHKRIMATYKSL